jgi:alkylation response protein AidB-like acyl-CoA dehydrogenase
VLLTRTGGPETPNHEAITAFFVDINTPGVTVRPLRTMHGVDEFCEVYFDDVVVPADRMLGNPGDGWKVAMDLLPYERSTCFWQRIAYLYSRFDALVGEVKGLGQAADSDMGETYLALHTLRCRSRATQHRLAEGHKLGPDTSIDKVLLASAEQRLYDTARDLMPGAIELDDTAWRTEFLYSRAATIYGGTAEVQRNIIARRLLDLGKE